jgi:hypothetical protein
MQLLVELASHPGEMVPAVALRRTLQIDANTLGRCWAELQHLLGDLGATPRYLSQEGTDGFLLMTDVLIDRPPIPTREQILGPEH